MFGAKELVSLSLATAVAFGACAPKPTAERTDPASSALVSTELGHFPDRIDAANFNNYFSACDSREQLLRTAQEQDKSFFPLSIGNPSDISITFYKRNARESATQIIVINAVYFISSAEGKILSLSEATATDQKDLRSLPAYIVYAKTYVDFKDVSGTVLTVENKAMGKGPDRQTFLSVTEGEFEKVRREGETVKRGDKLLKLGKTIDPSKAVMLGLRILPGEFSGDLKQYASHNGKILYCTPDKL